MELEDEEYGDLQETNINSLPEECLIQVFNQLDFVNRAKVEMVCQRWLEVSRRNWSMYSKKLLIGADTGSFPSGDFYQYASPEVFRQTLKHILLYRGPHLRELSFTSDCRTKFGQGTLEEITRLCPNLRHVDASNIIVSPADLISLRRCSQIETLHIDDDACLCLEQDFSATLGALSELREIYLRNCEWFRGDSLNSLPPGKLQKLSLDTCGFFSPKAQTMARHKNTLVYLEFFFLDAPCDSIIELTNLTTLILFFLGLEATLETKTFVQQIARHCTNLEVVHFRRTPMFGLLARDEIRPFLALRKLKTLIFEYKGHVREEDFRNNEFPNLTNLVLPCSDYMGETACLQLARWLPAIKSFALCRCKMTRNAEWSALEAERNLVISSYPQCERCESAVRHLRELIRQLQVR